MFPRSVRFFLKGSLFRAMFLTAIALGIYEVFSRSTLSIWPILAGAMVFWFTIYAVQRYTGWFELHSLASSGTLDDYLNSGLNKADVFLGVVYPARISELLSLVIIMIWFAITATTQPIQILFIVFALMIARQLWSAPFVFLPDAENFLRKRNPLMLMFISMTILAELAIWFTIYFTILFLTGRLVTYFGLQIRPDYVTIIAVVIAFFASRPVFRWWQMWRLKRFYKRYSGFEDLFDTYLMQGDVAKR